MPSVIASRKDAESAKARPSEGYSNPWARLDTSKLIQEERKICEVKVLSGPGEIKYLHGCDPIRYPVQMPGLPFVLHIVLTDDVEPAPILCSLREQGIISDPICPTTSSRGGFLVRDGRPGHYEVRIGEDRYVAHLLKHEPQHQGHYGSFAQGYSSFICGSQGGAISRVVLRGSFNGKCFVVSRSYSADCENVCQTKPRRVPSRPATSEKACSCKELQTRSFASRAEQIRSAGLFFAEKEGVRSLEVIEAPCCRCRSQLAREVQPLVCSVKWSSDSRRSGLPGPREEDSTAKYFAQRFRLISRFNSDLPLSRQAWFSVCPEEISKHIARRVVSLSRRLGRKIRVFDPFCGAGGNIVQAALMDEVSQVFASDIDAAEVECARKMAELYGVPKSKISFKVSDFFGLDPSTFKTPVDAIICSPPWGGPAYLAGVYDLDSMSPNYNRILRHCAKFTRNLALLMPRNLAVDQLYRTASAVASNQGVELELNFLSGKIKTSTVYYGDLVNKNE